MKSTLDQIEEKIKELFEHGSVVFPWMNEQSVLLHHLTESIHDCFINSAFEQDFAIDKFIVYMNPRDLRSIEQQSDWLKILTSLITEIAHENNVLLVKKPEICLVTKNSLNVSEVSVKIETSASNISQTGAVLLENEFFKPTSRSPIGCLIFENETIFDLDDSVVNIGRKSNNQLVINDLRISRNHAQIRSVADGYMIFDTGSLGGTYVNGKRITQHLLKSGDVISLAGLNLIFTQESSDLPEEDRQITSELNTPDKRE